MSVIVPFLNEADGIETFMQTLDAYQTELTFPLELVFVDDGSTDDTCEQIRRYPFAHIQDVRLLRLSRNFGSHAAIRAGLISAKYDICTWMGSDLQEPLELLRIAYARISEGLDAVYFEKESVRVGWLNRCFSKMYSWLMKRYVVKSYGKGGISTIAFNGKIKRFLNENRECNSSIMLQIMQAGFTFDTVPLQYNARLAGKSKWSTRKKIRLLVDSFVSFTSAPLKWVTGAGIALFLFGIVLGVVVIYQRLTLHTAWMGYATIVCLLAVGFGVTNISLGIISEYLWRVFDAARTKPPFIISENRSIRLVEDRSPDNQDTLPPFENNNLT